MTLSPASPSAIQLPERVNAALLPKTSNLEPLGPVVDLARMRRSRSAAQKTFGSPEPVFEAILTAAFGVTSLVSAAMSNLVIAAPTGVATAGLVAALVIFQNKSVREEVAASDLTRNRLANWLSIYYDVEPVAEAFTDLQPQVTLMVNEGFVHSVSFAAADGNVYTLSRAAKGGILKLRDEHGADVPPRVKVLDSKPAAVSSKPWMADGHLSDFTESDQHVIRSIRKQIVRLRILEPVSAEDEHAASRAGKIVEESLDLAKRAVDLAPTEYAEVFVNLRQTLDHVLKDLDARVSAKAAGTVHDARVLVDYAKEATAPERTGLKLS